MSNYAAIFHLKNAVGVDKLKFGKKTDLAKLKASVVDLNADLLKNVPSCFSSLKSKVDKLDVNKFVPILLI